MLLDNIKFNLENLEEHTCYRVGDKTVTYGKLNSIVKQIYCYLIENKIEGKVICYGHKQIEMIATFLAVLEMIKLSEISAEYDDEAGEFIITGK